MIKVSEYIPETLLTVLLAGDVAYQKTILTKAFPVLAEMSTSEFTLEKMDNFLNEKKPWKENPGDYNLVIPINLTEEDIEERVILRLKEPAFWPGYWVPSRCGTPSFVGNPRRQRTYENLMSGVQYDEISNTLSIEARVEGYYYEAIVRKVYVTGTIESEIELACPLHEMDEDDLDDEIRSHLNDEFYDELYDLNVSNSEDIDTLDYDSDATVDEMSYRSAEDILDSWREFNEDE